LCVLSPPNVLVSTWRNATRWKSVLFSALSVVRVSVCATPVRRVVLCGKPTRRSCGFFRKPFLFSAASGLRLHGAPPKARSQSLVSPILPHVLPCGFCQSLRVRTRLPGCLQICPAVYRDGPVQLFFCLACECFFRREKQFAYRFFTT